MKTVYQDAARGSLCRRVPFARDTQALNQPLGSAVLVALMEGTHRFSDLRRKIGG